MAAESPLHLTDVRFRVLWILNSGMVNRDVFLAFDLQCPVVACQVDGIATPASRFPTNGAVTAHEGIGLMADYTKPDRSTMAGPFEQHFDILSETVY